MSLVLTCSRAVLGGIGFELKGCHGGDLGPVSLVSAEIAVAHSLPLPRLHRHSLGCAPGAQKPPAGLPATSPILRLRRRARAGDFSGCVRGGAVLGDLSPDGGRLQPRSTPWWPAPAAWAPYLCPASGSRPPEPQWAGGFGVPLVSSADSRTPLLLSAGPGRGHVLVILRWCHRW